MKTDWIQDEILRGLQKLLSLSLERTPASELLPITVGTWVEAITRNRDFDADLDGPRFRAAFVRLAETRLTWPAPRDFLEVLPERSQLRLEKTTIPANPTHAASVMAEIEARLRDGKSAAAGPDA